MVNTKPVAISLVRFEIDFWLSLSVVLICSPDCWAAVGVLEVYWCLSPNNV
jgi:hypothetical protein